MFLGMIVRVNRIDVGCISLWADILVIALMLNLILSIDSTY